MAKSGTSSTVIAGGSARSADTRRQLVDAAIETLKAEGYAGASARAIAERAGSNQGLVFYHFGSVANLLLAALDSVSAQRLAQYDAAVARVGSPSALVDVAAAIFREDLDAGYVTVLVEMIAGSSSTPGLGSEVAARIGPWFEFAQRAIEGTIGLSPLGSILPAGDVAYAVVALYLGLEMLTHLDGDRTPALALFAHAKQLTGLLEALRAPSPKETT
jgi:AcrR family transcriptional regulator